MRLISSFRGKETIRDARKGLDARETGGIEVSGRESWELPIGAHNGAQSSFKAFDGFKGFDSWLIGVNPLG